jgi:predicted  nucleic acid-binding Zn-ribbon protein
MTRSELEMECTALAYEMVQLERWAAEAFERRQFVRVGELHEEREQVQQQRSSLLRRMWHRRLASYQV